MTEVQRVRAIQTSNTPGGDGTAVQLDCDEGALNDLSSNLNDAFSSVVIHETLDSSIPTVSTTVSPTLNLGTGVLTFTGSETLDARPKELLDLTKMRLSDVGGGNIGAPGAHDVVLTGAAITTGEGATLVVTLTGEQRAAAIAISGKPGGDLGALVLDVFGSAFTDIGTNRNADAATNLNVAVVETLDTIPPTVISAELNLSTGVLIMGADEILDATPATNSKGVTQSTTAIDLDLISLCDVSNQPAPACVVLTGAATVAVDSLFLTITLTELQRSLVIAFSGQPGGDNGAMVLDVKAGGVHDIGTVANLDNLNIAVTEHPDVIQPSLHDCLIDYGIRKVTLYATETLDLTASSTTVDLSLLILTDKSGNVPILAPQVGTPLLSQWFGPPSNLATTMYGGVITDTDDVLIELTLTELARSLATQFNGITPLNQIESEYQLSVGYIKNELADVTVTQAVSGATGTLRYALTGVSTLSIAVESVLGSPAFDTTSGDLSLNGGSTIISVGHLSSVTITSNTLLDASIGALRDVAGNLNLVTSGLVCREIADTTKPTMSSGTIDFSDGTMILTFNEIADATPTTHLDGALLRLSNNAGDTTSTSQSPPLVNENSVLLSGATVATQPDSLTLTIVLTEQQRTESIALSSTAGGDNSVLVIDVAAGAARDVSTNLIATATGITLTETADSTVPTITSSLLNYSTGILIVTADEFIDTASNHAEVDVDKLYLSDTSGALGIHLTGSTHLPTGFNTHQVTIKLTELQRVTAIAISSTPGGDGGAVVLDCQASAFEDVANNPTLQQHGISVTEIEDTIDPNLLSATLNLTDVGHNDEGASFLRITADETIDTTHVDLTKLFVVDQTGDSSLALTGAAILPADGLVFTIVLTEVQRVFCLERSGEPGGDNVAILLDARGAAVSDVGERPNPETNAIVVTEAPDSRDPRVIAASINLGSGVFVITHSETVDATPSTNLDLSKLSIVERDRDSLVSGIGPNTIGSANLANLLGATVAPSNLPAVTMQLTPDQRDWAIRNSNTPGGDRTPNVLEVVAAAIRDMGLNPLDTSLNITVVETPDTTPMTITSATIDLNNGTLVFYATEHVRTRRGYGRGDFAADGEEFYDLTKIQLVDVASVHEWYSADVNVNTDVMVSEFASSQVGLNLLGSTYISNDLLSSRVEIHLGERARVAAMQLSNQPSGNYDYLLGANSGATFGGDGTALKLDLNASAFRDVGLVGNALSEGVVVEEIFDTTLPFFTGAEIHYGLGYVRLFTSEIVDITPNALFNLSKIFIVDQTGQRNEPDAVCLEGAFFNTTDDSTEIFLTLSENQRIAALLISGVAGGDGTEGKLDAAAPCMRDLAGNFNPLDTMLNLSMYEIPDVESPEIKSVHIDYSTGTIQIHLSEKILENYWYMGNFSISDVSATGDEWKYKLSTPLTPSSELTAGMTVTQDNGYVTTTFALSTPTTVTYAAGVAVTQANGGGGAVGTLKIRLGGSSTSEIQVESAIGSQAFDAVTALVLGTGSGSPATTVADGDLSSATPSTFAHAVGTLKEALASGVAVSSLIVSSDINQVFDIDTPLVIGGTATIAVDDFESVTPTDALLVDLNPLTNIFLVDENTSAIVAAVFASSSSVTAGQRSAHLNITLSESQRVRAIAISSTPGGDGNGAAFFQAPVGAFTDVSLNDNIKHPPDYYPGEILPPRMFETPDSVLPQVVQAILNFGKTPATLTIQHSEFVDQSPTTLITSTFLATKYQLRDDADVGTTILSDLTLTRVVDVFATGGTYIPHAEITPLTHIGDGENITFALTEAQRVRLIQLSGTPGGDGTPLRLRVASGLYTDIAQNPNLATDIGDLEVLEIQDTTPPTILSCTLDLNDGRITVTADETLDADPAVVYNIWEFTFTGATTLPDLVKGTVVTQGTTTGTLTEQVAAGTTHTTIKIDGAIGQTFDSTSNALVFADTATTTIGSATLQSVASSIGSPNVNVSLAFLANVTGDPNEGYIVWSFQLSTPASGTSLPAGAQVTQTSNSGTGVLEEALNGASSTSIIRVRSPLGKVFNNGAPLVLGDAQELTLPQASLSLSMEWTFTLNPTPTEATEALGVSVTQAAAGGTATGTLRVALGGTSTSTIKVTSAVGQVFDTSANLVLNGGTTVLSQSDLSTSSLVYDTGVTSTTTPDDTTVMLHTYHFPTSSNAWIGASLQGALAHASESHTIALTMTEKQRVRAIRVAGDESRGGDRHPILFEAEPGFVMDMAQNLNARVDNLVCTETQDTTLPLVASMDLYLQNYDTGVATMTLHFSETVYSASIDVTKISLVNGRVHVLSLINGPHALTAAYGDLVTQSNGFVTSTFVLSVATTASELLGATVTQTGTSATGTLGVVLDGSSVSSIVIRSNIGSAAFDALNPLSINGGTTTIAAGHLTSSSDVTTPHATGTLRIALTTVDSATTSALSILSAEGVTFDALTSVTVSATSTFTVLAADINTATSTIEELRLNQLGGGATITTTTTQDGLQADVLLTELQRVQLIAWSNTPGGDGVVLTGSLQQGALNDVALNGNPIQSGVLIREHADTIVPDLVRARLFYETGLLSLDFNETMDGTLGKCS